ncbi:L-threonine ammonia-lyase [Insolitispirillum peregrinum]|uniref:L-threonine ammonia-lyase n=2 Tax=Insolitispirillum peregrinum TaxID=80876 RepID=A0A1N7LPM8_9PROT|nr:L-threonine ammonia-lyase [Insolitispirillum peregrinum]
MVQKELCLLLHNVPAACRRVLTPHDRKVKEIMSVATIPPLPTLEDVTAAAERIKGAISRSPTVESVTLGQLVGARVALKFENLQFTASFKERGALNRLLCLPPEAQKAGVIAMSAGNHAQGVAYHAQRLGIPATIVMPRGTPFVKVEHTEHFGATVLLEGDSLAESFAHALAVGAEQGLTFVHPYDDPLVIAGQGTAALEMLEDTPWPLDVVVVPIGGGGLISGMATAIKALSPQTEVIGVQTALYPSMPCALRGDDDALMVGGATIAEGIAVKQAGKLTREVVRQRVDDIVLVDEDHLERAIVTLLSIEKTVVEGAGAAALAAVLSDPQRFAGRSVGLVLSGGNIDQRLLASVILRDLVRGGRLARLQVRIPDQPGALARITALIAKAGGNIVDVAHQRVFSTLPAKETSLEVAVETMDARRLRELIAALRAAGYTVEILDGRVQED